MVKTIRQTFLVFIDILAIYSAYYIAFFIRFDFTLLTSPSVVKFLDQLSHVIIALIAIKIFILYIFGMYSSLWRHASIDELAKVIKAVVFATAMTMSYIIIMQVTFPRSIYVISLMLDMIFIGGVRFAYRYFRMMKNKQKRRITKCKNVMIIGAGQAGAMIVKEMLDNPHLNMHPSVMIDDDCIKQEKKLNGVLVFGGRESIEVAISKFKVDEIIIAMPSVSKSVIKEFVELCNPFHIKVEILPGMYELMDGKVSISQVRDVNILDILGREEIDLEIDSIHEFIDEKVVLITGAGGSIGSELCRQIMHFNPAKLIMLDIYENGVYEVELELKKKYPHKQIEVLIASVRDRERIFELFNTYRPNVVFHAAAHKHVPLMETSPMEAVKNNVFGTKNVVDASIKCEVSRFTLISTDKAVNPTNIMGATKRICELIVQSHAGNYRTKMSAVRFGNVLGSNGSVIPIFKKQIEEGGPVTLTHPEIIRYFMTIPEAARLVIQSTSLALEGEIFILDMGDPVKIKDLAENMIRLSGFEPGEDIQIQITGLRPGEKLYEELILDKEKSLATKYPKIFIEQSSEINKAWVVEHLDQLRFNLKMESVDQLKNVISTLVPTYSTAVHDQVGFENNSSTK